MEIANQFYSAANNESERHEFDLKDLGVTQSSRPVVSFRGKNGWSHIRSSPRPTNRRDYDDQFVYKIGTIEPIYRVLDFFDYHFQTYLQNEDASGELFLSHIRYVILPVFDRNNRKDISELITKWITNNEKMLLSEQLQQKNRLFKRAYEAALAAAPSSPFSVQIRVDGISEDLKYDLATTKRIVQELVADGYATSVLGMVYFFVTNKGLRYLHELESPPTNLSSISFNVGDNSTVQFQHSTNNSHQQIRNSNASNDELLRFLHDIKSNIDTIGKYLSGEQLTILNEETAYLESNLKRPTPQPSIIKSVGRNVIDIIKSIPANIIANVITGGLPDL